MEIEIHTDSPEQSRQLGFLVGRCLDIPAVIGLKGDLGCGKTVFVQGLARGLDVPERYPITSPTYTFINEYPGRRTFFHVDLYRITDPEELTDIGFEEVTEGRAVAAIEWAERLPAGENLLDMIVTIQMTGDYSRTWRFFFYGRGLDNLIRELTNAQLT